MREKACLAIASVLTFAAADAVQTGSLPCSASEVQVLLVAASIAQGVRLDLGQAVTGLKVRSKARRLGIIDESTDHDQTHEQRAQKPAKPSVVPLLGRAVPTMNTEHGLRVTRQGQPIAPRGVTRYLQQTFGATLPDVRAAMAALAAA